MNCKRCGWDVRGFEFTEEQKLEIWGLKAQDLNLFAINSIRKFTEFDLKNSKAISKHINIEHGHCVRCKNQNLTQENEVCSKCSAFNFNWNLPKSFDKEFCEYLEWKLDFNSLGIEAVKGYWCDGVNHIPQETYNLSNKNISLNERICTNAWIGRDGQGIYQMSIKLGKNSLTKYLKGQKIIDCIPNGNYKDWININPDESFIEVALK